MTVLDRTKAAMAAFIESIVSRYDYAAAATCIVVSQNADGSVNVRPESAKLPPMAAVPIRWPAPGIASVTVDPGCRVVVEFEGLDPSRPIVTAWDSATSRKLLAFTNAGTTGFAPVARKGDAVHLVFPAGMTIVTAATIPPATPVQVITVLAISPAPQIGGGIIADGNPRVQV